MSKLRLTALTAAACLTAAVAPAAHASSLAFTGIRPGTLITTTTLQGTKTRVGGFCTADFVFQATAGAFDPTQQLYIGTAGHCANVGDTARAVALAPGASTAALVTIGTVVMDFAAPDDFALIEIDPAMNSWVSPSMAHWGGPTGVYTGTGGTGTVGTFIGHVGFVGDTVPRVGELESVSAAGFLITGVLGEGDSGGPVTS